MQEGGKFSEKSLPSPQQVLIIIGQSVDRVSLPVESIDLRAGCFLRSTLSYTLRGGGGDALQRGNIATPSFGVIDLARYYGFLAWGNIATLSFGIILRLPLNIATSSSYLVLAIGT